MSQGGMGGGGQQGYGGQSYQPWQQRRQPMMAGFGQQFQKTGQDFAGTSGYHPYTPNVSPPPTQPQPPTMSQPIAISDPPGAFGYGGQPTPPTQYGNDARQIGSPAGAFGFARVAPPSYNPMDGKNGSPMQQMNQNIGGFNPNSMQGQYRAQQQQSLAQAPDAYGLSGYMQNGQFNRGAAVNDYYGALDRLRQQGVSGQINLYDQFKGADGRYNGPMNNAMIADFSGGWQGNGQTGDLWTGKRNGKNYWLGNEVDDHQFNERFKQGI
jgi:hypothetical protein